MARTLVVREHQFSADDVELSPTQHSILVERFSPELAVVPVAGGAYRIRAGHHVGCVVVGDLTIFVEPKLPLANIFYLLGWADDLSVPFNDAVALERINDFIQYLLSLFADRAEAVCRGGLIRGYEPQTERLPVVRGRILVNELLRDPSRAHMPTCLHSDHTADVPLNRCLRTICHAMAPLATSPEVGGRLLRCERLLSEAALLPLPLDDRPHFGRLDEHYQRLLKMSAQVVVLVTAQLAPLTDALFALDVRPSQKEQATRAMGRIRVDLAALGKVREACEARVIRKAKVPMSEKVLSVSDPDAGFISKGQRDPVIGYKPQIARSGGGFIVGLSLPKGNAADSKQLIPMLEDVMSRTQVIPNVVSVDDGYASSDNKKALEKLGIDVISINGAKGKALTSAADWESDEYAEARRVRLKRRGRR